MCRGRRPRRPLHFGAMVCYAAKSLRSLWGCFAELDSISGAGLCFDFCFVIEEHLVFFFFLSVPLGRLAPIEALPQTPLGALPLDPTSPLAPGLSLRFISRYARCWGHDFGQLCHSSFLTPHSSFERRFPLHIVSLPLQLPFLPLYFAVLCNFTIIFGCFNVKNQLSRSIPLQTLFSLSKQ